jgi:hypothetical protein
MADEAVDPFQALAPFPGQEHADALVLASSGIAVPVCDDVPVVTGDGSVGATLSCTMGNWSNEPTSYAYQWQRDGEPVGTDAADYTVVAADAGKSIACVVTATNGNGSTTAPASNAVSIAAAAAASTSRTRSTS